MTITEATTEATAEPPKAESREPIPPSDTPKQYRAIGLLKGRYVPGKEEFTKGMLLANDGTSIEAVVLGRLVGLLKSRMDMATEHLWVVYPRTRDEEPRLHVQLKGIWEPETLHPDSPAPELEQKPDYFSIQGEVVFQNSEEGWVVVKIVQVSRQKTDEKPPYFNLKLFGFLPDKPVKNFWHLHVEREGTNLVIQDGERIAYLGEKKPKKKKPKKAKKPHRSGTTQQPPPETTSPKEPPKLKKKTTE